MIDRQLEFAFGFDSYSNSDNKERTAMKKIISNVMLSTTLTLVCGLAVAYAQTGPSCPPGTAPQTTSNQVCIKVGPVNACCTNTHQTCQPLPQPSPKK